MTVFRHEWSSPIKVQNNDREDSVLLFIMQNNANAVLWRQMHII